MAPGRHRKRCREGQRSGEHGGGQARAAVPAGLSALLCEAAADYIDYDSFSDFVTCVAFGGLGPRAGLHLERGLPCSGFALAPGDPIGVTLNRFGNPLAEHRVAVFRIDPETATLRRELLRTDAAGVMPVVLRPGVTLLNAVELRPAKAKYDAEWLSTWAPLTFALP